MKRKRKINRRANEVYSRAWQSEMLPSALQLLYLRGFAPSCSRWWATHSWATLLLAREFLRLHKPERWDSSPQCWCFQAAAGDHQYLGELQQRVRKSHTSEQTQINFAHKTLCHPNISLLRVSSRVVLVTWYRIQYHVKLYHTLVILGSEATRGRLILTEGGLQF